jgi:photosystem II stability/assembly factor-like uncharacterized protein
MSDRRLSVLAAALALATFGVAYAAIPATPVPNAQLAGLEWRLLGPFRGGWATMAVGIDDQPDTFYFSSAGGGIWKTTDAGNTWQSMSDGLTAASFGAIAVAPSNPNVLYAGSGQPEPRYDIAAGDGMYTSTDGGRRWQHIGLEATRHIGAILVDARDPTIALVGALGHIFGANPERGVFRTADGGKTWTKTLFVDADTGIVDLAADPAQPNIVFAAAWQARNWPWLSYFMPIAGPGSGIYKSLDGGVTWQRLGGEGWPSGSLGRIGLAVTHLKNGATRIYASIDSGEHGGLYRSDDGGAHWQKVNDAKAVATWYMSRLTVAPNDPDTLYTTGQSIHRSTDAGKTFTIIRGAPGGDDYHHVWINPKHPDHLITASDQGAVVSVDGGAHWSSWYNQPTGQFYHLATDNRFPYRIYSGQQDSGTVGIASRSDYGALSFRDWGPVGGDERDYDLPDPTDPQIVYGSGLGGRLSRWDARSGEVQNISPWPVSTYGARATEVKYRYTWISPIAISAQAPHALYAGAQVLFRSMDQGRHWERISPDLTGKRDDAPRCNGDVAIADATACGYGVIFSIAPSPRSNDEIWIGTDNGRVHLTRDGGKTWQNVTPSGLPDWAKVSTLDVSALEEGTAYAAVDNHRQDDFAPYIYRTHDNGKTWAAIRNGLPDGHFVATVRADTVRKGLLYAGTDIGVYVSFDDGDHWQTLQRNLPVALVNDLLVHGNDLIAATQGRALWVLDDVGPLRQIEARMDKVATRLFAPSPALRVRDNQNKDTPPPPETPLGRNPPAGATLDYTLARAAKRVTLEIRDNAGHALRRFDSAHPETSPDTEPYFEAAWIKPAPKLATDAGAHRFVWDLRTTRPRSVHYDYAIAAVRDTGTPLMPRGWLVAPGDYRVVLNVDGHDYTQNLRVDSDPRMSVPRTELDQSIAFAQSVAAELARAWQASGEIAAVQRQIEALTKKGGAAAQAPLKDALAAFAAKVQPLRAGKGEAAPSFGSIGGILADLYTDVEGTDRAPTAAQQQVLDENRTRLDRVLAQWQSARGGDLTALNARLKQVHLETIHVPAPDEIRIEGESESEDMP